MGKIRDFVGNFSEYREARSREEALEKNATVKPEPVKETISAVESTVSSTTKRKLTFKEQRELRKRLKKKCLNWKEQRAKILDQLNNEADYEKIAKLFFRAWKQFQKRLENQEMRWLELQELL